MTPKIKKKDSIIITPELMSRIIFRILTGKEPTAEQLATFVEIVNDIIENPIP